MNFAQKQYELGFHILGGSQRFNTTNYFRNIDTIRSRQNQYPTSPKQYIIKKNLNEPFKDFFVLKSNERFRLKLETIQSKPVIPKLNEEYIQLEQRMKNNRERTRELYNRALSLENEKFAYRVFTQKPRFINAKFLEKIYANHEKNIAQKSPKKRQSIYNSLSIKLPKISGYKDWKYNLHSRTEANLDSDNENSNDKSLELKDHGYKEISHKKQGYIEGQHNNQEEKVE